MKARHLQNECSHNPLPHNIIVTIRAGRTDRRIQLHVKADACNIKKDTARTKNWVNYWSLWECKWGSNEEIAFLSRAFNGTQNWTIFHHSTSHFPPAVCTVPSIVSGVTCFDCNPTGFSLNILRCVVIGRKVIWWSSANYTGWQVLVMGNGLRGCIHCTSATARDPTLSARLSSALVLPVPPSTLPQHLHNQNVRGNTCIRLPYRISWPRLFLAAPFPSLQASVMLVP
jgi:hypothetical protein